MFMDPGIRGHPGDAFCAGDQTPDSDHSSPDPPVVGKDLEFSEIFSDINLGYITRMIMEENMEDKGYMHQGDSSLFCADAVNAAASAEPFACPVTHTSPNDSAGGPNSSDSRGGNRSESNHWVDEFLASSRSSQQFFGSSSKAVDLVDETQLTCGRFPDMFMENLPLWQCHFNKGMEEANKFLPEIDKLIINTKESKNTMRKSLAPNGSDEGKDRESRGRKKSNRGDFGLDLEERRSLKQHAAYQEGIIRSKMFDEVLLCKDGTCTDTVSALIEILRKEANQNTKKSELKGSSSGKSKSKKKQGKEVVDLRTLLIHCAQSVAADDHRNANELLKQIREHSTASRTASQKLALIFADGLEARLAGTGSQVYHSLMAKKQSAVDILKAYRLYIAACPFKRISHFFANQTILNVAKNATRLHIIDFGISFGFQWPCLIQQLSKLRPGGAPMLRITGIDLPQSGFRPNEWVDETGRRLDDYCRTFNVPFEYHSITSKWEDIQIEDLKIKKDEVLVVNSLYRFRNLADETVLVDSPRDIVLNNIRKMNPDVFIHEVINGSYSAPFFVTRFREALFFYSSLFDMLETTIPRDHPEKLLIENEIFGREAINVVACEGSERVERPETYKQWQVRSLRAGFKQLPLNPDISRAAKDKVRSSYHKDFIIDEDGRWLLQGWKGRIIYALSTWIPTAKGF